MLTQMPTHQDADTYVNTLRYRHILRRVIICQHICSCAGQCVDMSRCRHICRHIKMLTYMPTYQDADIYANISRCWHICQHIEMSAHSTSGEENADIYVNTYICFCDGQYADISRCRHIWWHIKMLTYMSTHWDADTFYEGWLYVNTFVRVLANVLTCPDADIYADMSRCRHICWHIKMLTHMSTHWDVGTFY